jgi:hypothetical protein
MNSITQKTLKPEIGKASLPITHHASRITHPHQASIPNQVLLQIGVEGALTS